jgi:hypothetical protein
MLMPGRKYQAAGELYRNGFNGQEKSDDVTAGNYTAKYWEYDSRIGRRWNRDPVLNISESGYACFGNNPIYYSDPNGDFKTKFGAKWYKFWHGENGSVKQSLQGKRAGEWYITREGEVGKKGDGKGTLDEFVVRSGIYGGNSFVDNAANKVSSVWNSFNFVATGSTTFSVGTQIEIKDEIKLNNGNKIGFKIGGGYYVKNIVGVKAGYDGKWSADIIEADKRAHNYVVLEVGGKIFNKSVGLGAKYDYNYLEYNGYYGPRQDGPASHDYNVYIFGASRGNKSCDDVFKPLSNPATFKPKIGMKKEGEKEFLGVDITGSLKIVFGIEYSLKLGISY